MGRKDVLDGIYRAMSKPRDFKILADKTIKYLFFSPDKKTRDNEDNTRWAGVGHMKDRASSSFMKEAWELYVNSIFSWRREIPRLEEHSMTHGCLAASRSFPYPWRRFISS